MRYSSHCANLLAPLSEQRFATDRLTFSQVNKSYRNGGDKGQSKRGTGLIFIDVGFSLSGGDYAWPQ
ncbi:MAG: hypothetical protein ACMZI0_12030 [Symbiopectobacterium sp.]|uniref:hypothetical protein n=1 Tax=Symbiopectobacterium sp. TaxID=2952789 RepID=UPI0039EB5FED